jgi:hypothetical protein
MGRHKQHIHFGGETHQETTIFLQGKWKNNVTMNIKETGFEDGSWMEQRELSHNI